MTAHSSYIKEKRKVFVIIDLSGRHHHALARTIRELGVFSVIKSIQRITSEDITDNYVLLFSAPCGFTTNDQRLLKNIEETVFKSPASIVSIGGSYSIIASILGGSFNSNKQSAGRMVKFTSDDPLFLNIDINELQVDHRDVCLEQPPKGARVLAVTSEGCIASFKISQGEKVIYGIQVNPESLVENTGIKILDNMLKAMSVERYWNIDYYYELALGEVLKYTSGNEYALAAVSGGVDSLVSALIAKRVLGDRLIPVFIDHGLFREGEPLEVMEKLRETGLEPLFIDAKERFLSRLEGVEDCEKRRLIIGEVFAELFDELITKHNARILIQGTIYPDIVESGLSETDRVKSHHNVAGLPGWFRDKYIVIEPVKYLYKDEVRALARKLNVPKYFIKRHPFPGPGLAARVIGPFTRKKLEVCRRASRIVEDVLRKHGLYSEAFQAFAVVGDDKWVGVKHGLRREGFIVTVRIVRSIDAVTADYARIPYDVLEEISSEIRSSIDEVTMVTYAITPKPPSTIEPC